MIIQELQRLQTEHGYLPRQALRQLADRLAVPHYRIQEVASFYPHFRLFAGEAEEAEGRKALPQIEVAVCRDMACRLRGAAQITEQLQGVAERNATIAIHEVSCLGRCDRAPAVRVHTNSGDHCVRNLLGRSPAEVSDIVARMASATPETADTLPDDKDGLLPHSAETWKMNAYAGQSADQRYAALRQWLSVLQNPPSTRAKPTDAPPSAGRDDKPAHPIIAALWTANLLGMGGAGGRAWKKWDEVLRAKGHTKYVVCNGDESEPGTFKDREIFLRTPYLVIEGMILAGLLLRAKKGYIYIRHEYEEQIAAVRAEIERARKLGLCGKSILGTELGFELEVFVSPGGYICGEQTALIQAIQDERAEPRNRPPELQTNGLWDMPTLLNNVETFAWVPAILTQGNSDGAWYSALGQPKSLPVKENATPHYQGARFFSVSGDVAQPGVYEVPIGITLGELIDHYCGGIKDGLPLKAVATSGPSAGFLPATIPLDAFSPRVRQKLADHCLVSAGDKEFQLRRLPLELGVVRDLNLMLGGGIVVYASDADLVDQAVACLRFYQSESCGKCVPCRIGSTKLVEIGEDLQAGRLTAAEIESLLANPGGRVLDLAQAMAETAICGLGNVAPNPLRTLLSYFPSDVRRHVRAEQ
ncbi:NADP-reducing hydrogenase subunit HndC [Anatilimnocola aggregata]|uniref:NADP-reducing hydrogenase subunit HndC n=1 Tax=Anatilimnocola aggregata TaxID=2528021 RepID=A0A517YEB4_9BACT|nr:NADH-ubiquinone oxidoreductase-F iron-sulfur binding region domain-containing protein [Anatilimnocola aggregata]QDU28565.1 NADP-reducing hydrogenase subunit HndC [Anatilimnocola aggregata]